MGPLYPFTPIANVFPLSFIDFYGYLDLLAPFCDVPGLAYRLILAMFLISGNKGLEKGPVTWSLVRSTGYKGNDPTLFKYSRWRNFAKKNVFVTFPFLCKKMITSSIFSIIFHRNITTKVLFFWILIHICRSKTITPGFPRNIPTNRITTV